MPSLEAGHCRRALPNTPGTPQLPLRQVLPETLQHSWVGEGCRKWVYGQKTDSPRGHSESLPR